MDPAAANNKTQKTVARYLPFAIAVSFWLLSKVDPFGLEQAAAQRSEQYAMRMASAFYAGSQKVAVIVVDDDYLANTADGIWPMSYSAQSVLLRRTLSFKPSVVFLDLLYRHRHSGEQGTLDAKHVKPATDNPEQLLASIARSNETQVFVAGLTQSPLPPGMNYCTERVAESASKWSMFDTQSVRDEIRNDPRVQIALVGWYGCAARYPLLLAGDPRSRTPAYAMYRAYCDKHSTECSDISNASEASIGRQFQAPMSVYWGAFAPQAQEIFYKEGVCTYTKADGTVGLWQRMTVAGQQFLASTLGDIQRFEDARHGPACTPVAVLPASALNTTDPKQIEALQKMLGGKLVLIGTKISSVQDWVNSPVQGQVPGVLLHAMALDNLLAMHSGYVRHPLGSWQDALSILGLIAFAYLLHFLFSRQSRGAARGSFIVSSISLSIWFVIAGILIVGDFGLEAVFALLVGVALDLFRPHETVRQVLLFLVIAIAAIASIVWLGWTPANWIIMALIAMALTHTIRPYYGAETEPTYPHPASALAAFTEYCNKPVTAHKDQSDQKKIEPAPAKTTEGEVS